MVVCDLGYRGHDYKGDCDIQIVNKFRRKTDKRLLCYWNRRSAIEPIIGHLKREHGLGRTFYKGEFGDLINPIYAAIGYTLKKLLEAILLFLPIFMGLFLSFFRQFYTLWD